MMLTSLVVAEVHDTATAATLYDELLPFAGRNSHDGAGTCGPVDLALGRLAAVLGRGAEATAHFGAARELCRIWNAPMWSARTAYEHARMLVETGGNAAGAQELLASCVATASSTGQTRLRERATALQAQVGCHR